jgi:hypothetical protein
VSDTTEPTAVETAPTQVAAASKSTTTTTVTGRLGLSVRAESNGLVIYRKTE